MRVFLCCLFITLSLSAYSTKTASDLVYLAEIAYSSAASITAWNCAGCSRFKLTDVKVFANSTWDMQGYVGYSASHGAVIVSFRGSNNIKNWIDDFDATHISYSACSGCLIHQGFYQGYMTVSAPVKAQVTFLLSKYRNVPIYITGHSLGGALCFVAALDLHKAFKNVDKVYTYGQPRVGNAALATYFAQQIPDTFRVVHYGDVVPHLPPMNMNYRQNEFQVWYQEDMKSYKICSAQEATCADSMAPTHLSTSDHDISNYIKLQAVSVPRITEVPQETLSPKGASLTQNLKRWIQQAEEIVISI